MDNRSALLLFIKSPERGKVKSRLATVIGAGAALEVYKCLAYDTVETLKGGQYLLQICFHPPDSEAVVKNWLGSQYACAPQRGSDLGERMKNAFIHIFSDGIEKAVLVGGDIPDLTTSLINEAFKTLDTSDAVIGPALDGGYYLIGFSRNTFLPDIFGGIAWSTGSVFDRTMSIFEKSGRSVHVLPGLSDIDTFDDLEKWLTSGKAFKLASLLRRNMQIAEI